MVLQAEVGPLARREKCSDDDNVFSGIWNFGVPKSKVQIIFSLN